MSQLKKSRNRVVVITGGTMGIGRATAMAFAESGWSVGILARGQEGLHRSEAFTVLTKRRHGRRRPKFSA